MTSRGSQVRSLSRPPSSPIEPRKSSPIANAPFLRGFSTALFRSLGLKRHPRCLRPFLRARLCSREFRSRRRRFRRKRPLGTPGARHTSTAAGKRLSATWRGVGYGPNRRINPIHLDMHRAKRCGREHGAGSRTSRQEWRMVGAGCTAAPSPGASKVNQNAFKHGRYTADAIARRLAIAALIRAARSIAIRMGLKIKNCTLTNPSVSIPAGELPR